MAWQIDNSHSQIEFTVRHMMVSKTRGRFEQFTGTIEGSESNPAAAKVDVTIDVNSLNTRDERRDGHLKSADFFDAENHPTITFKSTRVDVVNDRYATLVGDLTIRGVTKEVALAVEFAGKAKSPWGTTSAGFSATTTINRKDFGLVWNQTLETGGLLVGEEISIEIDLELLEVPEQVPAEVASA
ncbi:MAG TPA: YceI family protein [Roseiflexaceae bacterium]|nr:YceI family protein [Roseiflexaceae bacterium]